MKKFAGILLLLFVLVFAVLSSGLAQSSTVEVFFPTTSDSSSASIDIMFNDDWFDKSSDTYNHDLAQISIGMAMAAFRDGKADLSESDHYIRSFFDVCGFTGYEAYGYSEKPTADSISNAIAYRELEDKDGSYILIAVPVCGQGYGDEWLSNFTVNDQIEHTGFAAAADTVYERLKEYVDANFTSDQRIKVWATGFSRAAAVSNILGVRLLDDERFDEDDVFVYCYGTPNTTREPRDCTHIYNICGSFDPVPHVPFADWGYGKNGVTYYLPSRETTIDYTQKATIAKVVYRTMLGTDTGFDSVVERNWLLTEILDIMAQLVPSASDYSAALQGAVIKAWNAEGSMIDKLTILIEELNANSDPNSTIDTEKLTQLETQLIQLTSAGVAETLKNVTGEGGSTVWFDILSSGKNIAHEHFPEVYCAWLNSTDDEEDLFGQGNVYTQITYTGNLSALIVATGEYGYEKTVLDTANNINELATVKNQNQTFVSLPAGLSYHVTLTVQEDNTTVQFGYRSASTVHEAMTLSTTKSLTLYKGETLDIDVADPLQTTKYPDITLDQKETVHLHKASDGGAFRALTMEGSTNVSELNSYINSALTILPYLFCSIILLIYAIVVAIKRAVRHQVDDTASCRLPGKILLILTAAMAASLCINPIVTLGARLFGQTISDGVTNHTLRRASEVIGIGLNGYLASQLIFYALMTELCITSIKHYLSRIRLVRLSLLILLLNTISLFFAFNWNTMEITDILTQIVPLTALIGLLLARVRTDKDRYIGKRWLPVSRAILFTALVFFGRQAFIILFDTSSTVAVVLKAAAGIPALILALTMVHRERSRKHILTALAMGLYLAANAVINLSLIAGIIFYVCGHIALFMAYAERSRLNKWRVIIWAGVSCVFGIELFAVRNYISTSNLIVSAVYAFVLAAMLVVLVTKSKRTCIGAVLFMCANQLLLLTFVLTGNFMLESVELLLYYIAILILSVDPASLNKGLPVHTEEEIME